MKLLTVWLSPSTQERGQHMQLGEFPLAPSSPTPTPQYQQQGDTVIGRDGTDSYSGGALFESLLGQRLYWIFSWFSSVPPGKWWESIPFDLRHFLQIVCNSSPTCCQVRRIAVQRFGLERFHSCITKWQTGSGRIFHSISGAGRGGHHTNICRELWGRQSLTLRAEARARDVSARPSTTVQGLTSERLAVPSASSCLCYDSESKSSHPHLVSWLQHWRRGGCCVSSLLPSGILTSLPRDFAPSHHTDTATVLSFTAVFTSLYKFLLSHSTEYLQELIQHPYDATSALTP
jgi:hypothetical protein